MIVIQLTMCAPVRSRERGDARGSGWPWWSRAAIIASSWWTRWPLGTRWAGNGVPSGTLMEKNRCYPCQVTLFVPDESFQNCYLLSKTVCAVIWDQEKDTEWFVHTVKLIIFKAPFDLVVICQEIHRKHKYSIWSESDLLDSYVLTNIGY